MAGADRCDLRRFVACLATRTTEDFVGTGIVLRDPWGADES
jgi:hypothetical protein